MRQALAILVIALVSACAPTSGGPDGKDHMRGSIAIQLPRYGIQASEAQLNALTVTQMVQMDAIMSDRGLFPHGEDQSA